ncbi:MAG TPA: DsbA family protein, partial [Azonexus sp.]
MTIEVHFDLICPWCLIGKRHLATALQRFRELHPDVSPRIVWTACPLLPDTPPQGLPYDAFYERRLGGKTAVAARRAQVQAAAATAGFQFNFEAIRVMPNTLPAHRLIRQVQQHGAPEQVETLIEKLFTAYFLDGCDIGNTDVLAGLA